jgi:serine/threonine-protein kinase HipA
MPNSCTLQLHTKSQWHDIASITLVGKESEGWRTPTRIDYDLDWVLSHADKKDAWAISSAFPVSLEGKKCTTWPAFLIDLLPQGYGRAELLRQLKFPESSGAEADWRLLLAGAGNPIGHLRVKEAEDWVSGMRGERSGFTDDEVASRAPNFVEHLATHGLFVAGSSGAQGEWPKLLLTRSRDGLLYLDHALGDDEAAEHYIVKFSRGRDERMAQILRHEAVYMDSARLLGLRVHAPIKRVGGALFIRRFDRKAIPRGVERLAQESLAAAMDKPGFGVRVTHEEVCRCLAQECTDPQAEILEYLKRDIANLALGNKDNHLRNTALVRHFDGPVALTPLFDFAPMYLHPDGIARVTRWESDESRPGAWAEIVDRVCEGCGTSRAGIIEGLKSMAGPLGELAAHGIERGMEPDVLAFLLPGILSLSTELEKLA